jgi:transposase InsO family protein
MPVLLRFDLRLLRSRGELSPQGSLRCQLPLGNETAWQHNPSSVAIFSVPGAVSRLIISWTPCLRVSWTPQQVVVRGRFGPVCRSGSSEGKAISTGGGALAIGRSKSWVSNKVLAYQALGEVGLVPAKRGPKSSPRNRTSVEVEEAIVRMRKMLDEDGLDAGAVTIRYHLLRQSGSSPSRATIHRILVARGFVTPQPQKRPRSSWIRFESDLANETWQTDFCEWALADGAGVDIITYIDDFARAIMILEAVSAATSENAVKTLTKAAAIYGYPASVLSDNGAPFTATHLGGLNGFEVELFTRGIVVKHGKPYHPQTQGKVERWHLTLKKWLRARPRAKTIAELNEQLRMFCRYYNETRPHSRHGAPPMEVYNRSDKATPKKEPDCSPDTRVRRDRIDKGGKLSLRYGSKLVHLGVGRRHAGKRVIKLINAPEVRVLDAGTFELLARFQINPALPVFPGLIGSESSKMTRVVDTI